MIADIGCAERGCACHTPGKPGVEMVVKKESHRQPRLWYHPMSGRVRSEETRGWIPLYEHPKEWRGLTKEERREVSMANRPYVVDMLEAHEEELKRRNT